MTNESPGEIRCNVHQAIRDAKRQAVEAKAHRLMRKEGKAESKKSFKTDNDLKKSGESFKSEYLHL